MRERKSIFEELVNAIRTLNATCWPEMIFMTRLVRGEIPAEHQEPLLKWLRLLKNEARDDRSMADLIGQVIEVIEAQKEEAAQRAIEKANEASDADKVKEFINLVFCAMPHLMGNGRYPAFQKYSEGIRDAKTHQDLEQARQALKK